MYTDESLAFLEILVGDFAGDFDERDDRDDADLLLGFWIFVELTEVDFAGDFVGDFVPDELFRGDRLFDLGLFGL